MLVAAFSRHFLKFVFARVCPNQHLRVVRAWHFHSNARASFFVKPYFFRRFGPILLPELILRRTRPPIELVGLSSSPKGWQSFPELFLAALLEGIARTSGCLQNLQFLSRPSSLSLVTFALYDNFFCCVFIRHIVRGSSLLLAHC